MGNATQEKDMN